jgi:hypothetical protein
MIQERFDSIERQATNLWGWALAGWKQSSHICSMGKNHNFMQFMQYRLCRISQTYKAWSSGKSAHVVFAECTVCKGSGSCQEGASLREVGRRIPKRNLFQRETTWPLFSFASDVECERLGSTRWWRWPRKRWRGRERFWVANRFSMLYRAQTKKNVEALGEAKGWRSTSDWAPWQHLASGNIWQSFRIIPGSRPTCLCPTILEGGAGGLELRGRSHQLGTPRCVVKQWR